MPDLRGFGESDKHPEPPAEAYSAVAQARSVVGLIDELGLERPVIAGYDIGSRIAQAIARDTPERVRALVVSPPLPGAGERVLSARGDARVLVPGLPPAVADRGVARRRPRGGARVPRALLAPLVGPRLRAQRRAPRPPRRRLRRAGRDDRLDRLVPRGLRTVACVAGRDRAGARTSDRHADHESCGRSTTRSSRARGRTASTRSSAPPSCVELDGAGHFTPSRRPRRSPPRSASGASSRSRAARRARCRPGPSAPPTPPGARAR